MKTSTKELAINTIATSIARYENYCCWPSKTERGVFAFEWQCKVSLHSVCVQQLVYHCVAIPVAAQTFLILCLQIFLRYFSDIWGRFGESGVGGGVPTP